MDLKKMLGLVDDIEQHLGYIKAELEVAEDEDYDEPPSKNIMENAIEDIRTFLDELEVGIDDL